MELWEYSFKKIVFNELHLYTPGIDLLCVSCICAGPLEEIRKLFCSNMFNMNEATCVKSQGLINENGVKFHILFINCSLEGFSDLVCWNVQERDLGII